MGVRSKRDRWIQDVNVSQRNVLAHDLTRNAPRFWGFVRYRKLNLMQWMGLSAITLVYLGMFVLIASESWPSGTEPLWQKILYGYGPRVLLSLPLVLVLLVLNWRFRRKR